MMPFDLQYPMMDSRCCNSANVEPQLKIFTNCGWTAFRF